MKKLLLSLLISFSTVVLAETPKGFFGIELMKNAKQYVTDATLAGKVKNKETIGKYYDVFIYPPERNPFYERYYLVIDEKNLVHNIQGDKDFNSLENCLNEINVVINKLENKYNFKLIEQEITNPGFKSYLNYQYFSNGAYLTVQCNEYSNGNVLSTIQFNSKEYGQDSDKFYDRGF